MARCDCVLYLIVPCIVLHYSHCIYNLWCFVNFVKKARILFGTQARHSVATPLIVVYITSQLAVINCATNVLQQNVDIDLSTYNITDKASHVFYRYLDLDQGNAVVKIQNVPKNKGFLVIQAHSFPANVTLSKSRNLTPNTFVTGTNVGLVEPELGTNMPYQYFVIYRETPNVRVLLAISVYEEQAPIPGGCNMIFNTSIAPYQVITYNDNIIRVDAQAASVGKHQCESKLSYTRLDMYHMYLYERNLDGDAYFQGVQALLTVDSITLYGRRVPVPIGYSPVRRYYSAYPGTGSVYAIIATHGNSSSAYVPAVTYACDINDWDGSCVGPVTVAWKVLCAIILFMGLFTCYFGHRFFKTQMFIFGFVFGGFISYISASVTDTLSVGQSLGISILFGSIYGAMWIVFWWRFGSPILSVFLPVAFIGYITSCAVFNFGVGDIEIFQSDLNYWGIFFSILIPMTVFLLIVTMLANILACSVLGASAVIVAVDHYVGGSIHYIILNNIRRATVRHFNLAVIDPPFQYRDIILSIVWTILVITGVYSQLKQQRGKPPFPPPPVTSRSISERTPLLPSLDSDVVYG